MKCLSCEKDIIVEPPCFIQMCKECIDNIKWGRKEENGERT
jgi:hypothetical protein